MYRDEKNFNVLEQDSSSIRIFETIFGIRNKTFSQEFNLSGKSGSIDWLVGAFYYWNSADQEPFPFALGSVLTGGAPLEGELYYAYQDTSAWAVFADATAQLSDKWYLTLGARYSREKAKASWNINPVAQAALGIGLSVGATPGPSTPTTNSWGSFTPRVSLRYELDPDSSIYLTYSQGFKSGQLTPNAFVTTPLDPEKIKAFELGFRHVGQDLRFDASVYHYDYKGLQLAYFVNGTGVYRNAANSEIYGAEAQVTASITDTLELNVGAAYTHAEYKDFPNAPSWASTGAGTYAATNIDGSGLQMMRTPKFTANVGLRNETPLAGGVLALSGNYSYSSKFPFDAVGNFMEPAYGILNLRAAWKDPSERWEFAVFGTNVTGEKYRVQVLPADFAINQLWGKPAAYGISLSYKLR
jgi:iron complex outermembrane receptor protein